VPAQISGVAQGQVRAPRGSPVGIRPALSVAMTHEALQRIRQTLVAQRASLLARWRQALSDENELLTEQEPDWRDAASATSAAAVIDSVGVHERRALDRIQSSLARIDRGTYGECVVCHGEIEEERLRALPETDRCLACAPHPN
jgi:DnaK suppressor protein